MDFQNLSESRKDLLCKTIVAFAIVGVVTTITTIVVVIIGFVNLII